MSGVTACIEIYATEAHQSQVTPMLDGMELMIESNQTSTSGTSFYLGEVS